MPSHAQSAHRVTRPLWQYALFGLGAGVLYATANTLLDVLDRRAPLVATLAGIHSVIDRGIPLLAGALLGVAIHYWRLRTVLAAQEGARADALSRRLENVARDQAVWVVAASTLHEIRNPLHTLGLLLEEAADPVPGAVGSVSGPEVLSLARAQMQRIESRLGALGRLAIATRPCVGPVALEAILRDVINKALARTPHHDISVVLELGELLVVQADENFIRVILENLVQNALDALTGRTGGALRLHGRLDRGVGVLSVRDNGEGISAALRESLFDPLAGNKTHGMGLGLAISRALARAMSGEVLLVDSPAPGAHFELRLPA